jgi:hypothetical protein
MQSNEIRKILVRKCDEIKELKEELRRAMCVLKTISSKRKYIEHTRDDNERSLVDCCDMVEAIIEEMRNR